MSGVQHRRSKQRENLDGLGIANHLSSAPRDHYLMTMVLVLHLIFSC